jgi:hypothetical protein
LAQRLDCSKRCRFITTARAPRGRARAVIFFIFFTRNFLIKQFTPPLHAAYGPIPSPPPRYIRLSSFLPSRKAKSLIANCYCDGFLTLVSRSLLNAGTSRQVTAAEMITVFWLFKTNARHFVWEADGGVLWLCNINNVCFIQVTLFSTFLTA